MSKLVITLLVNWACSATVMAVKNRSAMVANPIGPAAAGKSAVDISTNTDSGEITSLKSEIISLRADNSRLSRELAAIKAHKTTDNSSPSPRRKTMHP